MSQFRAIRRCLGVSQVDLARALGMTQANVSYLERGQTITPETAKKLIEFAASLDVKLSYDQVYGAATLPIPRAASPALGRA